MESRRPFEPYPDPQKKAQDAIDHATEVRTGAAELREKKRADKTSREPHLIADGNLQRCSVCGYPFESDVHPSMSVAFAEHLSKAHQPGQTSEDFSQAAFRAVKEATDKV
jgi:hypothetical protein